MQVSSAPISLLSYYVKQQGEVPRILRISREKELSEVFLQGDYITPLVSVIEYSGKVPKQVEMSMFHTVYLSTPHPDKWLVRDWISRLDLYPEIYKGELQKYSHLFEPDAYEYFWEQYKYFPDKVRIELALLSITQQEKIKIEDLLIKSPEEGSTLLDICNNLGKLPNTNRIRALRDSTLWGFFMGSPKKPPYIYYYLCGTKERQGRFPELYQGVEIVREAVLDDLPISTGVTLFNYWVGTLEQQRVRGRLEYKITASKLSELEEVCQS